MGFVPKTNVPINGWEATLRFGLTVWQNQDIFFEERVMGFEPTRACLGSKCLTTWLHPRGDDYKPQDLRYRTSANEVSSNLLDV